MIKPLYKIQKIYNVSQDKHSYKRSYLNLPTNTKNYIRLKPNDFYINCRFTCIICKCYSFESSLNKFLH